MSTSDWIIRPVSESDAPQLAAIYAPYVAQTAITFEYTVPSAEEFAQRIRKTLEFYPYIAAERDGVLLGYAYAGAFVGREAYNHSAELTIYLSPEEKGHGTGRKIYTALEQELLADEKELAEHNMLVDLGRNDIGRIAEIGSVHVDKYLSIERFSHVMHIGSTVSGQLRSDLHPLSAIDSILPAGTLSGAPKIRACEIINELEDNKRGIYGGAIGYVDLSGNIDTCISIRIAFSRNNKVFIRSGAGIVADSVPDKEFDECLNKAAAVINALKIANGGIE